jgi:phage host-nuclease inhibitor protein Gam
MTGGALDRLHKTSNNVGRALGTAVKVGALGAAAGIGIATIAIAGFVNEAAAAQQVQAQTNAVLASTKGIAGVTAEQVNFLATALSRVTGADDEAIQSGQNMLLTFTRIGKEVFPQATEAILDMATGMNGGAIPSAEQLSQTAIQVGKALNDPIAGVTALQRVGVKLTEAQKDQIGSFMAVNDIAGAQKIILKELQTEFGGSARAAGETFAGKMAILGVQIGNVKETLGNAFLPVLTLAATALGNFLADHQADIERFAQLLGEKVADAIREVGDFILNKLVPAAQDLWPKIQHVADKAMTLADTLKDNLLPPLKEVFTFISEHKEILAAGAVTIAVMLVPAFVAWALAAGAAAVATVIAAAPVIAIALLIGLLVLGIIELVKHWDLVKQKTLEVWETISSFVTEKATMIWGTVVGAFQAIKDWVTDHWPEILTLLSGPFAPLVLLATDAFGIRSKMLAAFGELRDGLGTIWGSIVDGAKFAVNIYIRYLNTLIGGVESAVNLIAKALNAIPDVSLPDWLGGGSFGIPNIPTVAIARIPTLHQGGVVPGPIGRPVPVMALGGERFLAPGQPAGGGTVNVYIGTLGLGVTRADVRKIYDYFEDEDRSRRRRGF